jgi:hypothetical protein
VHDDALSHTIVMLDVAGSGLLNDPGQRRMRRDLFRIVADVLAQQGLDTPDVDHNDRGDGVRLIMPPLVPPLAVVRSFVPNLAAALRAHRESAPAEARLRLRVAIHMGLLSRDYGWVGRPLVHCARLLDARPVREVLRADERVDMVLVVSEQIYHEVVSHGYDGIDPDTYRPVGLSEKETHGTAWVHAPGYPSPPGLRRTHALADGVWTPVRARSTWQPPLAAGFAALVAMGFLADRLAGALTAAAAVAVAAAAIVLAAVAGWRAWAARHRPSTVDHVVSRLAEVVRHQWETIEEQQRRVQPPYRLPVLLDRPGGGAAPVGRLDDIARIYQATLAGRLVVLGRAGAGKTVLALRLLVGLLERAEYPPRMVPVIFSLASWNPTRTALRDWLAVRLRTDYPFLATRVRTGAGLSDLAALLVKEDRILPILDGFDEIAEVWRAAALTVLGEQEYRCPLVLTSRPAEYWAAAAEYRQPLVDAETICLRDLEPGEAAGYLAPGWASVLADPVAGCVRAALATPLMVSLARIAYRHRDTDPTELLHRGRFPDPAAVEEHLLGGFVTSVYDHPPPRADDDRPDEHRHPVSRWDLERVHRWLAGVATYLTAPDTQDVGWWQASRGVPAWLHRSVAAAGSGLGAGLILVLALWLDAGAGAVVRWGLWLVGAGALSGYALAIVPPTPPGRLHLSLRGPVRGHARRLGGYALAGLAGGTVAGFALAVLAASTGAAVGAGALGGLGGALLGVVAALEVPADLGRPAGGRQREDSAFVADPSAVTSPAAGMRAARDAVLVRGVAAALIAGCVLGLGPGAGDVATRAVSGLLAAVGMFLAFAAPTAWANWLTARVWLTFHGQLPWRLVDFLDDAHHRTVLVQVGGAYRFRHTRLREHLAAPTARPGLPQSSNVLSGGTR